MVGSALSVNKVQLACFSKKKMIILNWNWLPQQTGIEIAYLGELISDYFLAIDGEHDPRNQIWHDSIGQSSCQLIAAFKMEDYKTKRKTTVT